MRIAVYPSLWVATLNLEALSPKPLQNAMPLTVNPRPETPNPTNPKPSEPLNPKP